MWHQSINLLKVFILSVTLAATSTVLPAFAEGQGGNLDTRYTQVQFMALDRFQLRDLYIRYQNRRTVARIDGFSDGMSVAMLEMALNDRRAAFRLMNDMSKLKTKKDRAKRLEIERTRLKKLIGLLKKSIAKLRKGKDTKANWDKITEESNRLRKAEKTLKSVDGWAKHPMDGKL